MQQHKSRRFVLPIWLLHFTSLGAQTSAPPTSNDKGISQVNERTVAADKHFIRDYDSRPKPGLVNVIIEIPAGTNAKWEVDKQDGKLKWQIRNGKPRVVKYLSYPGNYGMVPRTLLPKHQGGDGDPLDVLVLGSARPRGSVVAARIIGVLKFHDKGEQDDKLIAVIPGSELGRVHNFAQLKNQFNGALEIIELWFSNYKGAGVMEPKGMRGVAEANAILNSAITAFEAADRSRQVRRSTE